MASQTPDPPSEGEDSIESSAHGAHSSHSPQEAQAPEEAVSEHIDHAPATEDLDEDPAYNPQDEHLRGIKGG